MNMNKLNYQYIAIQMLYYLTVVCGVIYMVPILQMQGFNSLTIGAFLGLRALLSVIFQPYFANLMTKYDAQISFNQFLAGMIIVSMIATLIQLFFPSQLGTIVAFILYGMFTFGLASFIDAMATLYHFQHKPINYPLARAAGSLSIALGSLVIGKITTPTFILSLQLLLFIPLLFLILNIDTIKNTTTSNSHTTTSFKKKAPAKTTLFELLRQHPLFAVFLVATIFSFVGNQMAGNFLIDVYKTKGGDNSAYGIGWFVLALSELPAALIFSKLLKKVGINKLLFLSFFFTALRVLLITIAPNLQFLIIVQGLQMLGNGLFYAGNIQFILKYLPADMTLKAQTMVGACYQGIGSGLGSLLSGIILGMTNLTTLLLISTILTFVGCVLFGFGVKYYSTGRQNAERLVAARSL